MGVIKAITLAINVFVAASFAAQPTSAQYLPQQQAQTDAQQIDGQQIDGQQMPQQPAPIQSQPMPQQSPQIESQQMPQQPQQIDAPEGDAQQVTVVEPHDKASKECQEYLQKMNGIIQEYDETVSSTLIGPQGVNMDDKSMQAAAMRTLKLAKELKHVHPPREIVDLHKELAGSLPTLHDFFVLNHGDNRSFNKALALADQVRRTLDSYHQGVLVMIARHGINPGLDPIAAEQNSITQRAVQGVQDWAGQTAGALGQSLQKLMQPQPQQNLPPQYTGTNGR